MGNSLLLQEDLLIPFIGNTVQVAANVTLQEVRSQLVIGLVSVV
jgi:hypothetical protein